MKIVRLEAEGFKRLRAVEITPDGSVVTLRGVNGSGKSSCLDSICAALGGEKLCPEVPVRKGETSAHVTVDLGDLVARRKWTVTEKGTTSSLEVLSKAGAVFRSPQAVLDKLIGPLSFDPLAFMRYDSKKQLSFATELVGISVDDLEAERVKVYAERTGVNREVDRLSASVPDPVAGDVPEKELGIEDVLARIAEVEAEARRQTEKRAEVLRMRDRHKEVTDSIVRLAAELEAAVAEKVKLEKEGKALKAEIAAFKVPDVDAERAKAKTVQATNERVRAKRARTERLAALEATKAESERLTKRLAELAAEREKRIKAAKWPVEGLGFTQDGLTLDGLPFAQASQAQQLRVSLAMGLALNPKLRVVLIREASLLDANSLALVGEIAAKADAQVWLEMVGTDGVGVVIEDGSVAGAPAPEKKEKRAAKEEEPQPAAAEPEVLNVRTLRDAAAAAPAAADDVDSCPF